MNQTVVFAVQAFSDQFEAYFSNFFLKMMYMQGPISEDINIFLQVFELARIRVQEMKRRATAKNFVYLKPLTNTTETAIQNVINKNKDNRKEKTNEETYKNIKAEK
jgi:hypothetical protein